MARIAVEPGVELECEVDDFLWPWEQAVPVFMVPGFVRTARFWDRWVPTIADRRRIYRVEMRGYGRSDLPTRNYRFEPASIFADLLTVMDVMGLEKVNWVGESSSGVLGLAFAASYPDRVASLVLCDSPYKIPDSIKPTYALDQPSSPDAIRSHGLAAWCRRTLHLRLDLDHASPQLQQWYTKALSGTPAWVAAEYNACFEAADVTPFLAAVRAPVLLLSGAKSKIAWEQQEKLKRDLPDARLHQFEGYGHGVNVLLPRECAAQAVTFWDQIGA